MVKTKILSFHDICACFQCTLYCVEKILIHILFSHQIDISGLLICNWLPTRSKDTPINGSLKR